MQKALARQAALERSLAKYIRISCGHSTDIETQQAYGFARPKRVKEGRATGKYKPVIPRNIRAAVRKSREQYAHDVIAGREPYPPKNSAEGRNLASLASKARHGKADPIFETKFKQYWYHKNDEKTASDADREDESDSADNAEE